MCLARQGMAPLASQSTQANTSPTPQVHKTHQKLAKGEAGKGLPPKAAPQGGAEVGRVREIQTKERGKHHNYPCDEIQDFPGTFSTD